MATLPSPTSWLVLCHIAQTTTATALLSHYPPSLSHVAAQGILLPTSSLPTFFFLKDFTSYYAPFFTPITLPHTLG